MIEWKEYKCLNCDSSDFRIAMIYEINNQKNQ